MNHGGEIALERITFDIDGQNEKNCRYNDHQTTSHTMSILKFRFQLLKPRTTRTKQVRE